MIRRFSSRLAWQLALVSFVVLGFALPAAAQGMITGTVVDAQGNPVADAKITIEQTDGVTRKFETKSDKKGSFIRSACSRLRSRSPPKPRPVQRRRPRG